MIASKYAVIALSNNLLNGIPVSSEYAFSLAYNSLSIDVEMAVRFFNPLLDTI
nr:MAG TPA: hypothetical protein [Caudoviricetes sp.]